jgi:hypothetical protein
MPENATGPAQEPRELVVPEYLKDEARRLAIPTETVRIRVFPA